MSDEKRLTIRIGVFSVIAACVGALLTIGATILAEGDRRGSQQTEIRGLQEWKIGADAKFKDFDDRLDRIDGNVQWIRGKLGGGSGE